MGESFSISVQADLKHRGLLRATIQRPLGIVGLVLTGAPIATAIFAGEIAPHDPFRAVGPPLSSPSWKNLMGTDDLGRDILSGVVYGTRPTIVVMAVAVLIAAIVGISLGALAATRGGIVDEVLMRITEIFQSVPRFFLAILVVALLGQGVGLIAVVLGLTAWPRTARVVRGEILLLKERGFVEAARALGASQRRILVRHLLPNALPAAIVVIALLAANVILMEASLRFLGLGDPTTISWGAMIRNGQQFLRSAWWMASFPGAAIVTITVGINLLADVLNGLLDPRSRQMVGGRPRASRNLRKSRVSMNGKSAAEERETDLVRNPLT